MRPSAGFINDLFTRVSSRYDVMNDVMSGGLHRVWKKRFIETLNYKPGMDILDVAAGTGDIASGIAQHLERQRLPFHLTAIDPNEAMIQAGKDKLLNKGLLPPITWMVGNAENLPLPERSQDLYTISFGLRNVPDHEAALSEAFRVLRPGGQFACLEFSHVDHAVLKGLYATYSQFVIPKLGKWVAKDEAAYQYLVDSIRAFPDAPTLKNMMEKAGFNNVSFERLSKGVVAIHKGWRPL